jgi:hypothetical protein
VRAQLFRSYVIRDEGAFDSGFPADVDVPQHRISRGMGGSKLLDRPSNVITLTSYWNGLIESSADAAAYALSRGWKLRPWMDPTECPVFHVRRGWLMLDDHFHAWPAPDDRVREWLAENQRK